jgi:hypothetical protein
VDRLNVGPGTNIDLSATSLPTHTNAGQTLNIGELGVLGAVWWVTNPTTRNLGNSAWNVRY